MDAGARVTQEQLPRSCSTGIVSEGLNTDDKEETDSLGALQPNGETLCLATESLTSFEPRSTKLCTGACQLTEGMETGQKQQRCSRY